LTYAAATQTYDTVGGSYQSQDDTFKQNTVIAGDSSTTYSLTESLYAFDPSRPMSQVSSAVDTNATQGSYLARDGIDLDQVGVDLKGYKVCNSIYPQGRFGQGHTPITFAVGAADYFTSTVDWSAASMDYDGALDYKLDFNAAGRFLSMTITYPDFNWFSLSGFDFDLDVLGER
jgi:hypothetical protein